MRSSIKIDFVDRGTGVGIEPVIRVEIKKSEDPRDTLISTLFQSLSDQSFLQFQYSNHKHVATSDGLPDMEKQVLLFKPEPQFVNIHDNSHGFRQLLDEKGIKWKPNEHSTLVDASEDLFVLGQQVGKARANSQPA
jgi:hypothetical protein